MKRNYNFCAGPSALPLEVLQKAQSELLDWHGLGASVMEISHRSKAFEEIMYNCEAKIRQLLNVPDNYHVLFLQGGAFAHFSMVPMNLLGDKTEIDMIETGIWSNKAISAMSKFAKINVVASTKESKYRSLPDLKNMTYSKNAGFMHYCDNETINGVEFDHVINNCDIPVVVDMSSNILSRQFDVTQFGLIYAGAQKNIGPSGATLIIVRDDLLGKVDPKLSDIFNYKLQSQNLSMVNTPPTFALYMIDLVLSHVLERGGVEAYEKMNHEKATMLYDFIDNSNFYHNPIETNARSRMNVPFTIANPKLDPIFLQQAEKNGLINLGGHRSVGGMRASIYNAMPLEGVKALCDFMFEFEKQNG